MPVHLFYAELLKPEPDIVIHMIAMGEADARAAAEFFRGHTNRVVWISSGDVYLAYGRFSGVEPGSVEPARFEKHRRCEARCIRITIRPNLLTTLSTFTTRFWSSGLR
jgi:hypothetical protein